MLWASFYWLKNGISYAIQLTEEEARTTARRAYENNPRLTSFEIRQAIGRSRQAVDSYIADLRASTELEMDLEILRMHRLGLPQEMRSIFYASSKQKAMEFFDIFRERWQQDLPSAVRCLESSIEACLTFFICPEEEWISLRTTNIIERLNKEFKRRTKPMEIVAGENACCTLLAFICLKMELHWKSNPIGKVRKNLPFLKELEDKKFTQKA